MLPAYRTKRGELWRKGGGPSARDRGWSLCVMTMSVAYRGDESEAKIKGGKLINGHDFTKIHFMQDGV